MYVAVTYCVKNLSVYKHCLGGLDVLLIFGKHYKSINATCINVQCI